MVVLVSDNELVFVYSVLNKDGIIVPSKQKEFTEEQKLIYARGYKAGYYSGRSKYGKGICKYDTPEDRALHNLGQLNGQSDREKELGNQVISLKRRLKLTASVIAQQDHLDEICIQAIKLLRSRHATLEQRRTVAHLLKSKLTYNERKQEKNLEMARSL